MRYGATGLHEEQKGQAWAWRFGKRGAVEVGRVVDGAEMHVDGRADVDVERGRGDSR